MIAIIPHVRNIPCLDCAGWAGQPGQQRDKLIRQISLCCSQTREGEGETQDLPTFDKICSEVKVKFYFAPGWS